MAASNSELLQLRQRPRKAKTDVVVAVVCVVPAASGGTHVSRFIVERTAAKNALFTVPGGPGRPVRWRVNVIVVPAVFDPFPYIAHHVVGPDRIRLKLPHRRSFKRATPGRLSKFAGGARASTPKPCACAAGPRCVFPLGFGEQAIWLSGPFRQPLCVVAGVLPVHARHRMVVGHRKGMFFKTFARIAHVAIGLANEDNEFAECDFVYSNRKILLDRYLTLRTFDGTPGAIKFSCLAISLQPIARLATSKVAARFSTGERKLFKMLPPSTYAHDEFATLYRFARTTTCNDWLLLRLYLLNSACYWQRG